MVYSLREIKEELTLENFVISIFLSIIYAGLSALFFNSQFSQGLQFGDVRPVIFFPALVSIMFGPVLGFFAGGFGNLLYDILENVVMEDSKLTLKNLVGFIANATGGLITGILAHPKVIKQSKRLSIGEWLKSSTLGRLFRNALVAVVGFGIVTGLIIGVGLWIVIPDLSLRTGLEIASSIVYWNSLVLLITVAPLIVLLEVSDAIFDMRRDQRLEQRRRIKAIVHDGMDLEVISAVMPEGDELFLFSWGAIDMVVKNTGTKPRSFRVVAQGTDVFRPSVHSTPLLEPGETDQIYFNVYPLGTGPRRTKMSFSCFDKEVKKHIDPRDLPIGECSGELIYEVDSSANQYVNKIIGFFMVIGLVSSFIAIGSSIVQSIDLLSLENIVIVGVILPLEFILIWLYYWLKGRRVTQFLGDAAIDSVKLVMSLPAEAGKIMFFPDDIRPRRGRVISAVLMLVSLALIGLLLWDGSVAQKTDAHPLALEFRIGVAIIVLVFLALSETLYSLYSREIPEEPIDSSPKFIERAILLETPTKFRACNISFIIRNGTEYKGLRVHLHSLDHVSPNHFRLRLDPGEEAKISAVYVPLGEGVREIGFEFMGYLDREGKTISLEEAPTIDQESIRLKVNSDTILGLSPSQISMAKKILTGAGAITLAVSIAINFFNLQIDESFLTTTIPLLTLLQAPVIFFLFYMSNKADRVLFGLE